MRTDKVQGIDSRGGAPPKSQKELLVEIMRSKEWSSIAKCIVQWQYELGGEFDKALWRALTLADPMNLEKFRAGFGLEVASLEAWRSGDIARRLRAAGLDI